MLAIFESHPVQYRTPVYRELQRLRPDCFHVYFATDVSMRGNRDVEFGKMVAWDEPMLSGYPNTVLKQERGEPLRGFRSLHGKGLSHLFSVARPKAILQTQFLYEYDVAAFFQASLRRIPIWIRHETQDEANQRPYTKNLLRSAAYRLVYCFVTKAFFIGELNRRHLVRHGIPPSRLVRAPYCAPDRFQDTSQAEFENIRAACRSRLEIAPNKIVIAFYGKLISKKNPDLILQAAQLLGHDLQAKITLLFVGSGVLEAELKEQATLLQKRGIKCIFAGFINQSSIRDYYAASDIVVLPSRREGETWGLVVNEALQAGCAVALSDAVGCSVEFGQWERVRTFPQENAEALARALEQLAVFPREFSWAKEGMQSYSTERAAEGLAEEIRKLGSQTHGGR